ncbi:hypothetical protein BD309DRAFT_522239 [Dichomitus squalens]|nr:hypothetical protein BD309DRAFT_522239 [Dichomitus squalens]
MCTCLVSFSASPPRSHLGPSPAASLFWGGLSLQLPPVSWPRVITRYHYGWSVYVVACSLTSQVPFPCPRAQALCVGHVQLRGYVLCFQNTTRRYGHARIVLPAVVWARKQACSMLSRMTTPRLQSNHHPSTVDEEAHATQTGFNGVPCPADGRDIDLRIAFLGCLRSCCQSLRNVTDRCRLYEVD